MNHQRIYGIGMIMADARRRGAMILDSWESGVDARGNANIWAIFPKGKDQMAFIAAYHHAWAIGQDRATRLNYMLSWRDVNGWGVSLACTTSVRQHEVKAARRDALFARAAARRDELAQRRPGVVVVTI